MTKRNMLKGASKGFTLIEMLFVVAILGLLIAVSIPFVGNSLETARVRVDMANERIAMGLAEINLLLDGRIDP